VEYLLASSASPGTTSDDRTDWFSELYVGQFPQLVRLAVLLLDDVAAAEDVVQEAYVKIAASRRRLRDPSMALPYLRQAVVNHARSALRRRKVFEKYREHPAPDSPSAEEGATAEFERQAVIIGLRALPRRFREVLVLRYYMDMTERQVSETLGISAGSVKSYSSRGLDRLAAHLQEELG
jgi:RNA polymerase sigma-70 factor (sigma-E family)